MNIIDKNHIPPCMIYINKNGVFYHKDAEIIRRDFITDFLKNMELDSQGRYVITWKGQQCLVDVEDTAFVVKRAIFENNNSEGSRYVITLNDGTTEILMPQTLWVGNENVLYCRVKKDLFPARFVRSAYYQLAEHIKEDNGSFYLPLGDNKYFINQMF